MIDDRWTVKFEPAVVDVSDRLVHVWEAGEGPPAVLLHGFGDDGSCWVGTAGIFTQRGFQVIAPDARAHGRTPLLPEDGFTAEERADDAVSLIEALGLSKALVVGHSMGALTAMLLAADHSDLVERAVLVDPPLHGGAVDPSADPGIRFRDWIHQVQAMSRNELTQLCALENPSWTPAEVDAWVSSKRLLDRGLFMRGQSWHGRPWQTVLARIEIPVLVLGGEHELGSAIDGRAGEWLDDAPNLEFARLTGAGHSVHRDHRVEFADLVGYFLDGGSSRV